MATNTENLNLIMPDGGDPANIGDINHNMVIIDGAVGDLQEMLTIATTQVALTWESTSDLHCKTSANATAVTGYTPIAIVGWEVKWGLRSQTIPHFEEYINLSKLKLDDGKIYIEARATDHTSGYMSGGYAVDIDVLYKKNIS